MPFAERMLKRLLFFLFCVMSFVVVHAQQDSIFIKADVSTDLKEISVSQNFRYANRLQVPITKIKLLNWIAAYKNEGTPLAKRKVEDRRRDLHFAKKEDLGSLQNLSINGVKADLNLDSENLYFELPEPLKPGESLNLSLQYDLKLPKISITGFGVGEGKAELKYFFIVPDTFETENQYGRHFLDIDETQNGGSYWEIELHAPQNFYTEGNLLKNGQKFAGTLTADPEFIITKTEPVSIIAENKAKETKVVFGYPLTEAEKSSLEFFIPLHLNFIQEKMGFVPDKIFISEKFKNKEEFFGNDDIKFWKFKFQMFTDAQKTDLDYISIITKNVLKQAAITEKNKNHWFKNGLKTYIEKQYLAKYYADENILGKLPENARIFGIKPLKYFNIGKLKLTERYGIAYQYIMAQNLDQKIGEPYSALSNFNDMAISNFETGNLFDFIAQKMTYEKFDAFIQNFLTENKGKIIDTKSFLDQLAIQSAYSSDFLETYINREMRVNFKAKKFKKIPEGYLVKISKNTDFNIPIKITSEDRHGHSESYWYDTASGKHTGEFLIPRNDINKIQLNDGYIFPEANYRDNYLYTKGFFTNTKKVKLKLGKDVPNPEYNEIYMNPSVSFNAYDKALLGLNFQNKSLFDQQFLYSFTPFYSTGTGKMTGSGLLAYNFRPVDSFFRNWQVGTSGSYFHYDKNLSYKKFSAFSSLIFSKVSRSDISRSLHLSYNYFEKDLTPEMVAANEYDKYGIWSLGYGYTDNKIIHEISFGSNLQVMKDFQKLSAEAFYRWEFAENKKVSFRFFSGYFFSNRSRNDLFNFGVSKVSNYAFSYNLLGQSATSGILSQQYVLAEGGFKSYLNSSVNKWITSTNVDAHVWKMFNVYADAGLYQNKGHHAKFIWDSGVKLKVIPDFLEVYFPVQSSLGFEPSFKDYSKRIRFTLVLNMNALTNHFRKGWY